MGSLLVSCGSSPAEPIALSITHEEGLQGFAAELDSLRVDLSIPGMAAALGEGGRVVWAHGFGYAIAESESAVQTTTPFHLASLTKLFTSTILMQLVEGGLVDLDDPVSDYGVGLSGGDEITVRHLLTHTSEGVPGSQYKYNGDRFGNLDTVIQSASGRSFAELLVERILGPLDLESTAPNPLHPDAFALTGLAREPFMARMAAGYDLTSAGVIPVEHPDYFGTAAGLVASAVDMAAFSIAIDQGNFLSQEGWEQVFTPAVSNAGDTLPYGLGWFIHYEQNVKLEWHYGWWTSNSSLIVRAPEKGLTFVVLANTNMMSRAYGLGGDSDVMRSNVARLFVEAYVLGNEALP